MRFKSFPISTILHAASAALLATLSSVYATDYTWIAPAGSAVSYATGSFWSPSGPPTASDNIAGNSTTNANLSSGTTSINNLTPTANWTIQSASGLNSTYVIGGTLTANSGVAMTFRNNSGTSNFGSAGVLYNEVLVNGGTVNFGSTGNSYLATLGTTGANAGIIFTGGTSTGRLDISTAGDYSVGSISTDGSFTGTANMYLTNFAAAGTGSNSTTRNATSTGLDGSGGKFTLTGNDGIALAVTLTLDESSNHSANFILANGSTGSLALDKTGVGTQILTGASTYTAGTTIDNGTLQLGNGGSTGAIAGNVSTTSTNAILAFDRSNAVAFSGTISGAGQVVQMGASTLTLSASNSYTGGTTVTAGTLLLSNTTAAGTGQINLTGGLLTTGAGVTAARNSVVLSSTSSSTALGTMTTGETMAGLNATTALGGRNTTAVILSGTDSALGLGSRALTLNATTTATATNDSLRQSDVFSLSQLRKDAIVFQLTGPTALSSSAYLSLLNGGAWALGTSQNSGTAGSLAGDYLESYAAFLAANGGTFNVTTMLGAYGVDTTTNTVWAVINPNAAQTYSIFDPTATPEPSTVALLAGAGALGLLWHRRRRIVRVS